MDLESIKENQEFLSNGYLWTAKYKDGVLMLFSDTDGFDRWAVIDQDNVKGLILKQ